MTDFNLSQTIDTSLQETVQSDVRRDAMLGGMPSIVWMARSGLTIPAWWSPSRDMELRRFWKKSDHLSGAVYAMESKMTAIPRRVVPRDPSIKEHVSQALLSTELIQQGAQFGQGWEAFFSMFVEELISQDNGAFAEIIGFGPKDGPILGAPLSVAILDSSRSQRTGNPEFPVIYQDINGGRYKLHYSRVMFASQMTSPIKEMFGIGFCSVSRAINVAQTLIDLLVYKQEKLGSRPRRAIGLTKGGLDPKDVRTSFELADSAMDSQGLSRYSKMVIIGSSAMPEADFSLIDLSSLPDGFDEQTSITLGMATIALAFGVDARELFPAMQAGATRADALLAHIKQRGKGPGQIIQTTEQLFNTKFLPPHLRFEFDFQDDAQDRQQAEIRQIRSMAQERQINSGALNVRILREKMVEDGDISQSQFERLELTDGRLPDGTTVLALFYKEDKQYSQYLNLGVDDPLDPSTNDPNAILALIAERVADVSRAIVNQKDPAQRYIATQCLLALINLQKHYLNPNEMARMILGEQTDSQNVAGKPRTENRLRREDLTSPNEDEELDEGGRNRLQPSSDDSPVVKAVRDAIREEMLIWNSPQ